MDIFCQSIDGVVGTEDCEFALALRNFDVRLQEQTAVGLLGDQYFVNHKLLIVKESFAGAQAIGIS